ncbi:MAG TPA: hypothetical protein PLB01_05835 [Thermoanaerobaculia bacterium]|nr:hypothetical protein [Thermoanaerobaculia bacterium]
MRKGALVLLALFLAGAAAAEDAAPPPLRLPPVETFRLFPGAQPEPRIELSGALEDRRLFHQPGDPDSQFTLGKPSPQGELRVLAVVDVNEIFLKAIAPDPLVSSSDTRPRAAGSFLPVDGQGRPYQLRLGARLVW